MNTPLCPVLGHVLPPGGSPVQMPAGTAYRYDAADAFVPLRVWREPADVVAEGLPFPDAVYSLQEGSGSTVVASDGTALTATAALVGQRAAGIFTGLDFRGRRAVELGAGAGVIQAANATPHNFAGESFAVLVVMRALPVLTANAAILGNAEPTFAGYRLEATTAARFRLVLFDGSTTINVDESGTVLSQVGAWIWVLIRVARGAGVATIETSASAGIGSQSLAGLSSLASSKAFRLGALAALTSHPMAQVERLVFWRGAEAEAMTGARLGSWWRHGRPLPWMSSYARTGSHVATILEDDAQLGEVASCWGPGQVALARHPAITTNERKLGILIAGPQSRVLYSSPEHANFNGANVTVTARDIDDPLGFRAGVRIEKTGAGGYRRIALGILAGGAGAMTATVWVLWDGTNTAPRLRVRNAADSATLATATYAGPVGRWARFSVGWTGGDTAEIVELHSSDPAAAAGTAWWSHLMVTPGAGAPPYMIPNFGGGLVSGALIKAFARGARAGRGTMRVYAVAGNQDVAGAVGGMLASLCAVHGANLHERTIGHTAADEPFLVAKGAAGSTEATATITPAPGDLASAEGVYVARWDSGEPQGYSVRLDRNADSDTDNGNLTSAPATLIEALYIGADAAESDRYNGIVSLAQIWPGAVIQNP